MSRFAGHNHVAHHGQFTSASERKTRHRCDDWLLHFADLVPRAELIQHQHINGGLIGHLLNVGPGCEGALVAGDDDGANAVVFVEAHQGVAQFAHELRVKRVQFFRAVEFNEGNSRCIVVGNFGEFHGEGLFRKVVNSRHEAKGRTTDSNKSHFKETQILSIPNEIPASRKCGTGMTVYF